MLRPSSPCAPHAPINAGKLIGRKTDPHFLSHPVAGADWTTKAGRHSFQLTRKSIGIYGKG
jgi:hypothetical protein